MKTKIPKRPVKYEVDGVPPAIKAKITEFFDASMEYAFIGAAHVEDRKAIEEALHEARYNLERTILTYMQKVST